MGTAIVLLGVIGMVTLIIRSMIKNKKAGKSIICGKNCGQCKGSCH